MKKSSETNKNISIKDLQYIWHPCTQMKDHEIIPLIPIKKAYGVYLEDFDGNIYIDAISSWWVNIFGHKNNYINNKIKEQLETLEHIILAGFTHKSAITLAERLVKLTPEGLEKVFFADNGSSGIEVALKMSFHYHKNMGKTKKIFVSLKNSYHGETMGALAIGDVELYKDTYKEIMIESLQVDVPFDMSEKSALDAIKNIEKVFQEKHNDISAIIIEPLIQCAGYMNMYHPIFITKLRELTLKYDIHLIADEVAVGFGRTGKMFACEHSGISPDFMVLSKGLTGGYLPLSVVLTTDKVYQAFYCNYNLYKAFLHSHSYTGNALACSAANATLDIFENENIIENNLKKIDYLKKITQKFKNLSNVKEVRQTGFIVAIELQGYKTEDRVGIEIYKYGLKNGVLLRPLGHIIYFMPPYIITEKEMDKMVQVAYEAIKIIKI